MDPALQEELRSGRGDDEIEALVKLADPGRVPAGLRIVARAGPIATARLRRRDIRRIWESPEILSIKAARLLEIGEAPQTRWSMPRPGDLRRPPGLRETGKGVVVGIIDWGIDFASPALRGADGRTRLRAIWDQRGPPGDEQAAFYGYGRMHRREAIDAALADPAPYRALGFHPGCADPLGDGSHGHHVADIIAGNGRAGGPVGIAPDVEIVFVHLSAGELSGLANLGHSVRICEACDFIRKVAAGSPLVLNTSLGRHGDNHRGRSPVEQWFDHFLAEAPGRAVAMSAGNYHSSRTHAAGRIEPGRSRELGWLIHPADRTANELEIWYSDCDAFRLTVTAPAGVPVEVPLGSSRSIVHDGCEVGRAYHRRNDPNSPDHHIDIFLHAGAPPGEWRIGLAGEAVVDGRFDAWIERDAGGPNQSRFAAADVAAPGSTGSICNGFHTIACGAYDAHRQDLTIGAFSSGGPTRDGRWKPDILAPGVAILAGKSTPLASPRPVDALTRKSGTSQAAPHVAGAICLMFEAAGRPMPILETRTKLLASARPLPETGIEIQRAGVGTLDIVAAVEAARPPSPRSERGTAMQPINPESMSAAAGGLAGDAPATIFDALTSPGGPAEAGGYALVGWAGADALEIEPGDLMIRRALAQGGVAECWPAGDDGGAAGGRVRRDTIVVRPLGPADDLHETAPSDYVRWIQQALNEIIGAELVIDGLSGPRTREAIRTFQRNEGLVADGVVGPKTEAALRQALGGKGGDAPGPGPAALVPRRGAGGSAAGIPARCAGIGKSEILDHFDFGSDKVLPRHQPKLINIARCILESRGSASPIASVHMIGFTDPVGGDAENLALGQRRADAVKAELQTILARMTGSPSTLTVTTESRGEGEQVPGDPALSRRVEIVFPHAFPLPVPVPRPRPGPSPTPVQKTATFELVSKSVILPVGVATGFIARCALDPSTPVKLLAFAQMLDASVNDSCQGDDQDGRFRMFAGIKLDVVHDGTNLHSVAMKGPTTAVGLECLPIVSSACLTPPALTVVQNSATSVSGTRTDFVWEVKGRPHNLAEPAFQAICARLSRFIWHRVTGSVEMAGGVPVVTASIVGSRFPAHCLFLDGRKIGHVPQGPLARLWDGDPGDPTRVL